MIIFIKISRNVSGDFYFIQLIALLQSARNAMYTTISSIDYKQRISYNGCE